MSGSCFFCRQTTLVLHYIYILFGTVKKSLSKILLIVCYRDDSKRKQLNFCLTVFMFFECAIVTIAGERFCFVVIAIAETLIFCCLDNFRQSRHPCYICNQKICFRQDRSNQHCNGLYILIVKTVPFEIIKPSAIVTIARL